MHTSPQIDGDRLVTSALDNSSKVWSASSVLANGHSGGDFAPQLLRLEDQHPNLATAHAFDPVLDMLCTGQRQGLVSTWSC